MAKRELGPIALIEPDTSVRPIISPYLIPTSKSLAEDYCRLHEPLIRLRHRPTLEAEGAILTVGEHLFWVDRIFTLAGIPLDSRETLLAEEEKKLQDGWGSQAAMERGLEQDLGINLAEGRYGVFASTGGRNGSH